MNKAILIGRITKDIELKATQSGTNICDFFIAVDRRFAKPGEERQTDFINCRAFRGTAEFISKWFGKGRMIAVVGSIQNNNWTDNNGEKHYSTNVVVDEAYFCGEKQNTNETSVENVNDFVPVDMDDDCPF